VPLLIVTVWALLIVLAGPPAKLAAILSLGWLSLTILVIYPLVTGAIKRSQ